MTAVFPTITESAEIFPSKCPLISTVAASIAPLIEPVSATVISDTNIFPFTRPATSIEPDVLKSPQAA